MSEIILSQILKWNQLKIIKDINKSLKDIIYDIKIYNWKNLKGLYQQFLVCINKLNDTVWIYFKGLYNIKIDENFKKWIIIFLISNNKLWSNNINIFLDLILDDINNRDHIIVNNLIIDDLILFKKLKLQLLERKWNSYNYEETLNYISNVLKKIKEIEGKIKMKKKELLEEEHKQYKYKWTMDSITNKIKYLNNIYEKYGSQLKEIEKKIDLINNEKEKLYLLEEKNKLTQKLIVTIKEMDNLEINYITIEKKILGDKKFMLKDEIEDLKIRLNTLKLDYKLIRKDILYLLVSWYNNH